jgi:hypothetical protein
MLCTEPVGQVWAMTRLMHCSKTALETALFDGVGGGGEQIKPEERV